ncbi:hypothetical protein EST38_g10037 [Candolleomyces aberdarensis]|uniref:Transmembrane protein n=1 Tax=Candolleomyces aberdarensis TaxID=2316362 RepID=A0A4Q2D8E9_9AGAR|nr:hypothetical protein EST38_g10037 [Candolleomyces aberdarensis]
MFNDSASGDPTVVPAERDYSLCTCPGLFSGANSKAQYTRCIDETVLSSSTRSFPSSLVDSHPLPQRSAHTYAKRMSTPPAPPQNDTGSLPTPDPQLSLSGTVTEQGRNRPPLGQRGTTLVNPSTLSGDPEKTQDDDHKIEDDSQKSDEKTQDGHQPRNADETSSLESKVDDVANPAEVTPLWRRIAMDLVILLAILFMILWPWVFFGVVEAKKGLQMYGRLAETIDQYPQRVAIVVTFIGTINRLIATFLFGQTIVRLGQELIAANLRQEVTVFGVTALLAFRHMSMVWGIGQLRQMKNGRGRWAILALLLAALGAFALVPSGTAGLITPGEFNKTAELRGTELDFTSTDPGCLTWLEQNRVVNRCDWTRFAGTQFTKCLGENQILDVLDSGRTNMLSVLGINNETSSLDQLGGEGGIRFLGSPKGVLPIGPDGIPAFNTLVNESNPFVDDAIRRRMVSYNYTLNQQGLESRVTCSYEDSSPIVYSNISNINTTRMISASGICDPAAGLEPVLENVTEYVTLNTRNTLSSWACKQTPQPGSQDSTYFFYLSGRVNYNTTIGNITCQINPLRAQDYSVEYLSVPRYFTSKATTSVAPPPTTFHRYIEGALIGLGNIVWESQSWTANVVAESVFSLVAKNLNLPMNERHPEYLNLFEKMIEGMLEYEATYSRLIYSLGSNKPQTCIRNVTGSVSYSVRGWYIEDAATQAGLLIPMTLINMASLSLLLACFFIGRFSYTYNFDATDNISLLTALIPGVERGKVGEVEWRNTVKYPQAGAGV